MNLPLFSVARTLQELNHDASVVMCLQCHQLLEEQEELLEEWFFKHYANGLDLDLEVYFCIDKVRGTFSSVISVYAS